MKWLGSKNHNHGTGRLRDDSIHEEEAEGVWMRLANKSFEKLGHKNPDQGADEAERGTVHVGSILQEQIWLTSKIS